MKITVANKHHGARGEYIGRGSPLGNPFTHQAGTKASHVVGTREEAVRVYRGWLSEQIQLGTPHIINELTRLHTLAKEEPLTLVCYCAPKPCHGDFIKEVLLAAREVKA